jgi:predicted nucleotidyltransferase
MKREEVLSLLGAHREDFVGLGVRSLRLFGSAARNEAHPGSDVDLLVDFTTSPTFRQYMKLRNFLEDLLGAKVDLVTESGLRPRVRPAVERDAIRVA